LKNTRPIRQKAETPAEINELFDGIAYGKAAAVLRMVEHYVDPELFRKGVHNYLLAHSYKNATAEDFWTAITEASGKPADKIMSSFVVQPGAPLLHAAVESDGQLSISQERFFNDRQLLGTSQQVWTVPVCWKALSSDSKSSCFLLAGRGQQTKAPGNLPIFANSDGYGFYRTEYEPALREQLAKNLETGLSPADRISMLSDQWALMRVGRISISNYLDLISQLKGERLRQVWGEVLDNLEYIDDKLVAPADRESFRQIVRNLLRAPYAALADTHDGEEKALRADLFQLLGLVGRDPKVIAEAGQLAERVLADPGSVDPLLIGPALEIAATQGDQAFYQQLVEKLKSSTDQVMRSRYMYALARFEKPELTRQALALGISGAIRNQDSTGYISDFLRNPYTRTEAWKFVQGHWSDVEKTFTTSSGFALVSSAGDFCDADAASNVSAFFKVHTVPATERTLRQAVERINACADLKKMQGSNLQGWLATHNSAAPGAGN